MGGPSLMMGAAHGGLANPLTSPSGDAKLGANGFTTAPSDDKGFANNANGQGTTTGALGMGSGGRLGLDGEHTVTKRMPKEETV